MSRPIRSCFRSISKIAASALLTAMVAGASVPRQSSVVSLASGNTVASDYYPMVHLRKLHLVRPDLIPYPIYYAVYC